MEKTIKDVVAETVEGLVGFYIEMNKSNSGTCTYVLEKLPFRGSAFDVEVNHNGIKVKFDLTIRRIEANEQQRQI